MKKKILIITTHPIQYNAPFFKLLQHRGNLTVKVLYSWGQSKDKIYDTGFRKEISWDIPLLEGYDFEFVENISPRPGSSSFIGIINRGLNHRILEWNPDVILVYGWNFFSHLYTMIKFKGKYQIFFRGDSTTLDEEGASFLKTFFRRLVLKQVYRFVDIALFVGSANKLYFKEHGLSEQQLIFSPHSIDNSRFFDIDNSFEEKATLWKKALGIENMLVFIFVGKFEAKKNPSLLIEVFNNLDHQNIALLLVGNGEEEANLIALSTNNKNILFIPFQNQTNMPIVYRLGDILVLPSKGPGETWGLVVNESFACGIPAIVSNKVGCSQDLIQQNVSGWVFESENADKLKNCMEEAIVQGKNGLEKMGKAAQLLIKNWSFDENANILERIVDYS